MIYEFSEKLVSLKPSIIREILKNTSVPGMISFAAGNPSEEAFPKDLIRQYADEILREKATSALQYGVSEGYTPFRITMMDWLGEKGLVRDGDAVIVTSGAQQGIDFAAKCLLNEGDTVICEEPSFIGALNTFRANGLKLKGIPLEHDGMDLTALEEVLKNTPDAKLIYVIPNFQNPTGITTSLEKRRGILALAKQYGVMILEDDPYGELRFAGEDVLSIKSMDDEGRVVYVGSFSKILAPGMRVGYALANEEIIAKFTIAKQTEDVHTNLLAQMICNKFMTEADVKGHIEKNKKLYGKKAALMLFELDKVDGIATTKPEGGLFIWCTLPDDVDMLSLVKAASERKLAMVPGNALMTDESLPCQSVRLNYSTPSEEQIVEGCKIFSELLKEMRGNG